MLFCEPVLIYQQSYTYMSIQMGCGLFFSMPWIHDCIFIIFKCCFAGVTMWVTCHLHLCITSLKSFSYLQAFHIRFVVVFCCLACLAEPNRRTGIQRSLSWSKPMFSQQKRIWGCWLTAAEHDPAYAQVAKRPMAFWPVSATMWPPESGQWLFPGTWYWWGLVSSTAFSSGPINSRRKMRWWIESREG